MISLEPDDLANQQMLTEHNLSIVIITINAEYGFIRDGSPQLVGCVADIFALVLLQGVHRKA